MQRKNKSKNTSTTGYGYESNNDNSDNDRLLKSSPSKPPSSPTHIKPNVGGISIASLTGHHNVVINNNSTSSACNNANCSSTECSSSSSSHIIHKGKQKKGTIAIATVKRNTFGTRPFDKYWLNLDCCGLICATLTYCLHLYGIYSFGWILLPPWFSVMDDDGYREVRILLVFYFETNKHWG